MHHYEPLHAESSSDAPGEGDDPDLEAIDWEGRARNVHISYAPSVSPCVAPARITLNKT